MTSSQSQFYFERTGLQYILIDKIVWSVWSWENWSTFSNLLSSYLVGGGKVGLLGAKEGELDVEAR